MKTLQQTCNLCNSLGVRNPILVGSLFGLLILFGTGHSAFGASTPVRSVAYANSTLGANAKVNGAQIAPGVALYPGDIVEIGSDSFATLQFGKSQVTASPFTEFVVQPSGLILRSGRFQLREGLGDTLDVTTPFFHVKFASAGDHSNVMQSGSAQVILTGRHAEIANVSGAAELKVEGIAAPYNLRAGEMATLNPANEVPVLGQQTAAGTAAGRTAGQVTRVLPQVQIDRASQQVPAVLLTPIFWNDDLHSSASGRARVTLQDGSLLNLGSNSELRVVQHDGQAQQTLLDLIMGRMRGKIMKLTRPDSKFEIRTPVGVAGLVGTDFLLLVTPDYTELMVFDGVVRFTVSKSGQAILVTAGMKLLISNTGAVQGPSRSSRRETATAQALTDVGDSPVQAAGQVETPKIPIVVSIVASAVVLAFSIWEDRRQDVSPWTLPAEIAGGTVSVTPRSASAASIPIR